MPFSSQLFIRTMGSLLYIIGVCVTAAILLIRIRSQKQINDESESEQNYIVRVNSFSAGLPANIDEDPIFED